MRAVASLFHISYASLNNSERHKRRDNNQQQGRQTANPPLLSVQSRVNNGQLPNSAITEYRRVVYRIIDRYSPSHSSEKENCKLASIPVKHLALQRWRFSSSQVLSRI
jgi:hypothetical protein